MPRVHEAAAVWKSCESGPKPPGDRGPRYWVKNSTPKPLEVSKKKPSIFLGRIRIW